MVTEWLQDRAVQLTAIVHPGLLSRDSLKMCRGLAEIPLQSARSDGYVIEQIRSEQARPDWIDTLCAAGLPVTAAVWQNDFAGRTDAAMFGALNRGRIVATAGVRAVKDEPTAGQIVWVAVDPRHRGHGLGRQVVLRALQHIATQPIEVVMLQTADHRGAAIAVYLELGFRACLSSWDRTQHFRWRRLASGRHPVTFCRDPAHVAICGNLSR